MPYKFNMFFTLHVCRIEGVTINFSLQIVNADNEIVEYKEALVCAFLGLRSLLNMENVFSSVTGSKMDTVSGSIHHGTVHHSRPTLHDRFNFMVRRRNLGVKELRIIKEK